MTFKNQVQTLMPHTYAHTMDANMQNLCMGPPLYYVSTFFDFFKPTHPLLPGSLQILVTFFLVFWSRGILHRFALLSKKSKQAIK